MSNLAPSTRGRNITSWSEQDVAETVRLYSELGSISRVAVTMSVSHMTARKVLLQAGVTLHDPRAVSRVTAEHVATFTRLSAAGLTVNAIAKRVGVASDTVSRHLMRHRQQAAIAASQTPTTKMVPSGRELYGAEPLRHDHPVVLRSLWRGLEHWRELSL